MGIATAVITSAEEYQRLLARHRIIFMLFVSKHCPACADAGPLFEKVAAKYTGTVKSLVLDTATTPRHEGVTRTPTLLVFKNGQQIEKLEGLGVWEKQEDTLKNVFERHAMTSVVG